MSADLLIGQGFDAHRFAPGRPLILGGLDVPHDQGLLAHSDGDVVIHALCDALLGAAALGDIGKHFPDTDDAYKGIDSRILLRRVMESLADLQLAVSNTDITIIAQRPKLAPYLPDMRDRLAGDLGCDRARVNVKATTTERMGFTGREEGIAAAAVVLLSRR